MSTQRDSFGEGGRSSSFARSFFAAGREGHPALDHIEGEAESELSSSVPVPASRPMGRRQASMRFRSSFRNRSLRGSFEGNNRASATAAEPAAAAAPDANESARNSWYYDAMNSGLPTGDLSAILGDAPAAVAASAHVEDAAAGFDDDEVLEQYRIMAQHEATLRVKENTGFDMVEYEKRRKMQRSDNEEKGSHGGKKPKTRLPEPKRVDLASSIPKVREPVLPSPRPNRRFVEQRQSRVPELCPGVVARGNQSLPGNEHVVRCLGCRSQLRVKILATLVSCPDCGTVSPASSTRR